MQELFGVCVHMYIEREREGGREREREREGGREGGKEFVCTCMALY